MSELESYWSTRYQNQNTGWDIGYPSTPIKEYLDQIQDKDVTILVPGCGHAYEAEYAFTNGFSKVYVLDISPLPLQAFKSRQPSFPDEHLILKNFFELDMTFDLIIEQTFFCSFEPTQDNRHAYAKKMSTLLNPSGKLVGLWFKHPLFEGAKRPFGGSKEEYLSYLNPYFEVHTFDDCYNSIPPRQGNELFGIFQLKDI